MPCNQSTGVTGKVSAVQIGLFPTTGSPQPTAHLRCCESLEEDDSTSSVPGREVLARSVKLDRGDDISCVGAQQEGVVSAGPLCLVSCRQGQGRRKHHRSVSRLSEST